MGRNNGSSRIQSDVHEPAACETVIGSQFLDYQVETSPTRRAECYYPRVEERMSVAFVSLIEAGEGRASRTTSKTKRLCGYASC